MDRSTIHYLKQKGWSNVEIAAFVGHHRDTIARVLREPLDQRSAPRHRPGAIAVFEPRIHEWLAQNRSVRRMLDLARADPQHPYSGSDAAFYDYVRPLKRAHQGLPGTVPIRFEGLPGELLQIDWGDVRQFPFTHPDLVGKTRSFFAARLKYSRCMWVRFTTDMREETLLRCLSACFVDLGGVPWVVTSDNMQTITIGRDPQHQAVWHPAFEKWAAEFAFHPAVCAPAAGNQKGAVENLVTFVNGNFLAGRTFYDDADLAAECKGWLHQVNVVRPSDATEGPPHQRRAEERAQFNPLPAVAHDYGFFESVKVSRESLVALHTNRYAVPTRYVGLALTARIYPTRIELFHGAEPVATHTRQFGRNIRVVVPEHYEAVFARKPRARIMVDRDWLVAQGPTVAAYISTLCRRRYSAWEEQICARYELARQAPANDFVAAVELALEQQALGAEYVRALLTQPRPQPLLAPILTPLPFLAPPQAAVERDLVHYEQYVANREGLGHLTGGRP